MEYLFLTKLKESETLMILSDKLRIADKARGQLASGYKSILDISEDECKKPIKISVADGKTKIFDFCDEIEASPQKRYLVVRQRNEVGEYLFFIFRSREDKKTLILEGYNQRKVYRWFRNKYNDEYIFTDNKNISKNGKKKRLKHFAQDTALKYYASQDDIPPILSLPKKYKHISSNAFAKLKLKNKEIRQIIISDSVEVIDARAFEGIVVKEKIYIPNSVTKIGYNAFDLMPRAYVECEKDSYAYRYCKENGIANSVDTKLTKDNSKKWKWLLLAVPVVVICVILIVTVGGKKTQKVSEIETTSKEAKHEENIAVIESQKQEQVKKELNKNDDSVTVNKKVKEYYYFDNQEERKNYSVGDFVYLGKYEQDNNITNGMENILWEVLDIEDGTAMFLSTCVLDWKQFHDEENAPIVWEDSSLRSWLNNEFYDIAFSEEEQQMIIPQKKDNVYLLESGEVFDNPFSRSVNNQYKVKECFATPYATENGAKPNDNKYCRWWTSTGIASQIGAVSYGGDPKEWTTGGLVYKSTYLYLLPTAYSGIRPVIWVKIQ